MKLLLTPQFKKRVKKLTEKNQKFKEKIINTLNLLEEDSFNLKLHTHQLHGEMKTCYDCSVGFEYRILFKIIEADATKQKIL